MRLTAAAINNLPNYSFRPVEPAKKKTYSFLYCASITAKGCGDRNVLLGIVKLLICLRTLIVAEIALKISWGVTSLSDRIAVICKL